MQNIVYKLKIWFIPCKENEYKPKFLAGNILFNIVLGLLILKIIGIGFVIYTPNSLFFADLTKSSLIAMTNQERQLSGLGVLRENSTLNEAAMQKAQDMLDKDYFAHQSPQGISPWYWLKQLGYNYKTAGENLAIGFLDSEEVLKAWENSPSHRENLLNPKFQETGMAVLTGDFQGSKATVVVQLFGTPSSIVYLNKIISSVASVGAKTTTKIQEKPQVKSQEITQEKNVNENNSASVQELSQSNLTVVKGESSDIQGGIPNNIESEEKKDSFGNKFFEFMIFTYPGILQKFIFYTLLAIVIALLLNVLINIKHQDKKIIAKTTIFIILLILFVLSDKQVIIQIIPHTFKIY